MVEQIEEAATEKRVRSSVSMRRWVHGLLVLALALSALVVVAPTAHAEEGGVHVVRTGESLASIARRYDVSMTVLAANNGISNPNFIYVGQRLIIPGSQAALTRAVAGAALPAGDGYHTVGRGDTMASIAQRHSMSVNDLLRLNGLTNPHFIWVGQQLRVTARVDAIAEEETRQAAPRVADTIHIVSAGETFSEIAEAYGLDEQELLVANGLPNPNFVWTGQRLRITQPLAASGFLGNNAPANGVRWIEVNLSNQTLTAWQGNVPVLHTAVSTGTSATPTVTGRFPIYLKYNSQHMSGPGYSLPGVPWVMYFYSGYAIHGAYWHTNWGTPMSHGCVNMRIPEAEFLFSWAGEGTEVYVHY